MIDQNSVNILDLAGHDTKLKKVAGIVNFIPIILMPKGKTALDPFGHGTELCLRSGHRAA